MSRQFVPFAAAFLVTVAMVSVTPSASASTISILPDRDNTLIQYPAGWLSNAKGDSFYVGRAFSTRPNDQQIKRGVIHFDMLAHVPPGATINSVQLQLFVVKRHATETVNRTVEIHKLLKDWGEGTSSSRGGGGDSTSIDDASWLHTFNPDGVWDNPGGDYDAAVIQQIEVGGLGTYLWPSNDAMVAAVQSWVDTPEENFGWILVSDESTFRTTRRYGSREHRLAERQPRLIIDYTAPDHELCKLGGVDAASGMPQNVLTINGSAGDGSRVVTVPVNSSISIDMDKAAQGPTPGYFVLYAVLGTPDASTVTALPKNLGNFCFNMPLFGADVQKIWNNIGRNSKLGVPDLPSSPAPSNVITVPGGTSVLATATFQGLILDANSAADVDASITNAVTLQIVPE